MTTLREAAQMALMKMEYMMNNGEWYKPEEAVEALRAALAQPPCATGSQCVGGKCERCAVQPEQEPWGYISHRSWKMPVFVEAENLEVSGLPFNNPNYTPVYKAPPQREWVGLTDEEMHECAGEYPWTPTGLKCCRAIEAKLKEKNT